jgi:hypothetical protein
MVSDGRKTAPISPKSDHRRVDGHLDRLIVAIAAKQQGLLPFGSWWVLA